MAEKQNIHTKKWRPHHIMCSPLLHTEARGDNFYQVKSMMIETIKSGADTIIIEPAEGPDELCSACSIYENGRCNSPQGDEDAVRKWDGILLRELGISYGKKLTAREWQELFKNKLPLPFCQNRCRKKGTCDLFKI